MNVEEDRAERFVKQLEGLKIKDPSTSRVVVWLRLSVVLMIAGVALAVVAYFVSHGTSDPLTQNDATILALIGVTVGVVGSGMYLRFALTNFLRFWLARQSFDLQMQSEYLASHVSNTSSPLQDTEVPQ